MSSPGTRVSSDNFLVEFCGIVTLFGSIGPLGVNSSTSTTDSLNPLFTTYKTDLLVNVPEPPINHCCPLLTEQGTTDFQPLLAKVSAVPEFPSTKRAFFDSTIALLLPGFSFLLFPSIKRLLTFELVSAAIEETLLSIAGHTVAGYVEVKTTCLLFSGAK